jgi:hypothetical protein
MITDELTKELAKLRAENERLKRLVFQSQPSKSRGIISILTRREKGGWGGATEYEIWLRKQEYPALRSLVQLYDSVIDSLRYRRRFVQHEITRQQLHSSYGAFPAELLPELDEKS